MIEGTVELYAASAVRALGAGLFLKATVVVAAALALVLALRRASASARHAIWSAAFIILFAVPVTSVVFPAWRLDSISLPRLDTPANAPAAAVSTERPASTTAAPAPTAVPVTVTPPPPPRLSITAVALGAVVVVWLGAALMMLLRLAVHLFRVKRITARARVNDCSEITDLAGELMESLGIRKRVRVVLSDEVTMPFAWGVSDPVVVFPAAAARWPLERKRGVLLHELAHIARWDYLVHVVVEVVLALYWPNPLVWIAARQKATERERACDDIALRQGTPSREYASHLIHVARMQLEPVVPVGAVTMTAKTCLADRVRYVMDKHRDRSSLRSERVPLVAIVVFFAAVVVGSFDVTASKWQIPKTGVLITELKDGEVARVRQRAAWWLGEHETWKAVPALVDALGDESAEVRIASAWALGEIKRKKAIAPLVRMLEQDDNVLAREMAALALGEIEDSAAIDALVRAFDDDDALRPAVVWALGEIGNRGGGEALRARDEAIAALGVPHYENEQVWAGSLRGEHATDRAIPELLDQLRSEDAAARRVAALQLGFRGVKHGYDSTVETDPVVDALLDTLTDPVPEVRAAAVWSLDEINPSRSARRR